MKLMLFFAALVLLFISGTLSFAAVQSTPIPTQTAKPVITHTPFDQYKIRLSNQTKLITIAVSKGKITKQQEKDLRTSLKNIRHQETSLKNGNADHKLTVDQLSQLNSLLDKNSQVISETSTSK